MSQKGIDKLIDKIQQSMSEGKFYESHQLWRTIYFRLLKQEKYLELAEILLDGSLRLVEVKQFQSASDLALLLVDVLSKHKFTNNNDFESWICHIAGIIEKIEPNVVERETLIVKTIKWSTAETNQKNAKLHTLLAQIMLKEENYEQARYHSLLSKNGQLCAKILIQHSSKACNSEVDMIIVQVVLNLLILKDKNTAIETFKYYTKNHPKIRTSTTPYRTPLLNFAYFLLNIIDDKKLQTFTTLCDLYRAALTRDAEYEKKLEKIGTFYFNAPVKQQNARGGGLFGDLFNQLFQEFENDSDSDSNMQYSSSSLLSSNVDLD